MKQDQPAQTTSKAQIYQKKDFAVGLMGLKYSDHRLSRFVQNSLNSKIVATDRVVELLCAQVCTMSILLYNSYSLKTE